MMDLPQGFVQSDATAVARLRLRRVFEPGSSGRKSNRAACSGVPSVYFGN
jgi:hypothetical protein